MRIKLNYIAPGLAAAAIGGAIAIAPSPAPIVILSCRTARTPKSHTCWGFTNRTTTKPTPRTANWTSRFNHNVPKAFEYGGLPAQTPKRPLVVPRPERSRGHRVKHDSRMLDRPPTPVYRSGTALKVIPRRRVRFGPAQSRRCPGPSPTRRATSGHRRRGGPRTGGRRRPKDPLADRCDLAVGHRDLPSMATTSGRPPMTTQPTRPYRPKATRPWKARPPATLGHPSHPHATINTQTWSAPTRPPPTTAARKIEAN